MPLQNRVDPYGNIISTVARGAWLGNRGVIHNAQQQIVRPFKLKAWIICELHFRGRHRKVMQPDRWTELFFLDEATAFSAGHRPCFQCRYAAHQSFKTAWLKGNPQYSFNHKTPVSRIDDILQAERIDRTKNKVTYLAEAQDLPDGTIIAVSNTPYLVANGSIHRWTSFGYEDAKPLPGEKVAVLTPASIVNAFGAGYWPQMGIYD